MKTTLALLAVIFLLGGCKKGNTAVSTNLQTVQIDYEYNLRDELNTFEGYVRKDLIRDGTIKAQIWLADAEQQSVIDLIDETGFFSFPDTIHREPDLYVSPDFSPDRLRISYNGTDKTVVLFFPMEFASPYTTPMGRLTSGIRQILESNRLYKKLPPANGGYD
jgi:hypothetical protein